MRIMTSGGERVSSLSEDLHEVVREVPPGQVQPEDGVREGVPLVDGDGVAHAVAGVEHDAGRTTGSVQGEHGLDRHVHGRAVERLEHDLRGRDRTVLRGFLRFSPPFCKLISISPFSIQL